MAKHSSLGASKAHRYRKCPGSIKAEEGLPDNAGEHAAQGTVFHEFAAMALEFDADPLSMVGATLEVPGFGHLPFTLEMAEKMLPGIEVVRSILNSPTARMFVEKTVSLEPWLGEGQIGTVDVGIVDVPRSRIVVMDWKWGAGVPVSPVENDQAILYALGLWGDVRHEFEKAKIPVNEVEVIVMIEQPRAPGGGGVWTTDMAYLLQVGREIKTDAALALSDDPPRIPGIVQCKFCKAASAGTCKEYVEFNLGLLGAKLDDLQEQFEASAPLELAPKQVLTPEQRSQILLHRSMIEKFLERIHSDAIRDAEAGLPVPGMKLVDGRSQRIWRDEDKAAFVLEQHLGQDAYSRKLLSPAAVEERVGKRRFSAGFANMVEKSEPKPILVPETDGRKARKTIQQKFDDLII